MNARWTFSMAAFAAVVLGGALLATAAAPNIGEKQLPVQPSVGTVRISTLVGATVLDSQGRKLGQIKNVLLDARTGQASIVVIDTAAPAVSQPTTYTAARPIDNPAPMPPPCVNSADSDLPQDLIDFYNE